MTEETDINEDIVVGYVEFYADVLPDFQEDDPEAQDALRRELIEQLLRIARKNNIDPSTMTDIVEDVLQRLREDPEIASKYKDAPNPAGWLRARVRYKRGEYNKYLKRRRSKESFSPSDVTFEAADRRPSAETPESAALIAERDRFIRKAIQALDGQDRELLFLKYIEARSGEEIGELVKRGVPKVYQLLNDARQRLKEKLREMGFDEGESTVI